MKSSVPAVPSVRVPLLMMMLLMRPTPHQEELDPTR